MNKKTSDDLKSIVKEEYAHIAGQSREQNAASCCGAGGCGSAEYAVFAEDYAKLKGYNKDADLALGCGIPTEFAQIKEGDTVLDLGSGAGNDAFIAHTLVGDKGKVIGIDFTDTMIAKARANNEKLGFNNVEFRFGDIENMPVGAKTVDVVISNCVLNLVPDKRKAFAEIFRVLKVGGHFSISDVVLTRPLPPSILSAAEMYAGCVAGAMQKDDYLRVMREAGFDDGAIVKEKPGVLPDDVIAQYLYGEELDAFRRMPTPILSITVTGTRSRCCSPENACA
jgi:SAM-dependent methyltransferase